MAPPRRPSRSPARPAEVGVALGLESGVRVAHEVRPCAPEHHLKVGRLESDVFEPMDDAGRRRDTIPAPEHGLLAAVGTVLEEDLHLAVEDEEHLLDLVRVRGVALARRHEHDAQRELLGGNGARVGLAGAPAPMYPWWGRP